MGLRLPNRSWLLLAALLLTGCASLPPAVTVRALAPNACEPATPLVLVADGAGDFRAASHSLAQVAAESQAPLHVEPFVWSHGYGRILADQIDRHHVHDAARQLAETILSFKQCHPHTPIYLVGHSAGSGVVLDAIDGLPPESVTRIILLAPAVSAVHDLKPALLAARQGVDVFYSDADWWYLGMGITMLGTTDRHWAPAAGRVGFRLPDCRTAEDALLYEKLRQHPWQECMAWTGHKGGHFGAYQPGFLRACVLPLLTDAGDFEK